MIDDTFAVDQSNVDRTSDAIGMNRDRSWWIPIRFKITLPFLFLAIFLAIGAAYVITQLVFDSVEERFTNQLIEAGKLASEAMVREENELLSTLRLIANTEGVSEAIATGDADQLRMLSLGIAVDRQEDAVEFIDFNGNLAFALRHIAGGNIEEYDYISGGDAVFLEQDYVQKVFNRETDEFGDKFSGYMLADWGDFFYVAGPVFDENNEFIGAILIGKRLEGLVDQIREETLTQVTVYDHIGAPIASSFSSPLALTSEQANTTLDNQATASMRREYYENSPRAINVSDIDYSEILGAWEVREDFDLGLIGAALPKTFLVSASQRTRVQITSLVAGAFLFVILIGVQLSTRITKPILGLVKASSKVAAGDLEVQVDEHTNDEISILSQSFNSMVKSLYKSQQEILHAYDSTLEGWSLALELRDKETEGHTKRVTDMTMKLAETMGMDEAKLQHVRRGVLLHDIGKMGIPDAILHKPGKLNEEEWEIMRQHPQMAYDMLKQIDFLEEALLIPIAHHERWDGTGYPNKLKGEEIPLEARIFAIVDVWDALISDRPYRGALPRQEVVEYIKSCSGSHFDPIVVDAFLALFVKQTVSI